MFMVRQPVADDAGYLVETFLKGILDAPVMRGVRRDDVFSEYRQLFKQLLADPKTVVNVVVLEEDPNAIVGYSVTVGTTLVWVYVRKDFRDMDVATGLVDGMDGCAIIARGVSIPNGWVLRPWVLYGR